MSRDGAVAAAETAGRRLEVCLCAVEATVISLGTRHLDRPQLLIIESDAATATQLLAAFNRTCWNGGGSSPLPNSPHAPNGYPQRCACGDTNPDDACCVVIDSLYQLHGLNLENSEVAICATTLTDASGLDALAYIRGMRPDLPVIVTGSDSSMAIEAIRGGALDFLVIAGWDDLNTLPLAVEKCLFQQRIKQENDRLHYELRRSLADLAVTNQQLQSVIRQLEAMARTDELTGLSNRRWFNLMLHGSWAEATRHDLPLACLMIDLDGFKSVNDRLGHHHGDEMLRLAAKVIRANCREVDLPARFGGDEFCVLMSHTEPHEAAMVADRMLREFETAAGDRGRGELTQVGMSIGLSHINLSRPINAEQLVSHADEAMYAAKLAGKHRVMIRAAEGVFMPMWRG